MMNLVLLHSIKMKLKWDCIPLVCFWNVGKASIWLLEMSYSPMCNKSLICLNVRVFCPTFALPLPCVLSSLATVISHHHHRLYRRFYRHWWVFIVTLSICFPLLNIGWVLWYAAKIPSPVCGSAVLLFPSILVVDVVIGLTDVRVFQ